VKTKDEMFQAGVVTAERFCDANGILMPTIERLNPSQRNYHLGTCAYYRPSTIHVMVEKCASRGFGGRAWSWPSYAIDRTPYGVIQHELGHHVDEVKTGEVTRESLLERLFSKKIWEESREDPLTGYLGTDKQAATFFMEWFAENFRLFVTNPDLSLSLRPRFYEAMERADFKPVVLVDGGGVQSWETVLREFDAPDRIVNQARKKIGDRKCCR
jgi:hypothetical protein